MKKMYGVVGIIALNLVAGQAFAFPIKAGQTVISHDAFYNGHSADNDYPFVMEDKDGKKYETFCLYHDATLRNGAEYTVSAVTNSVISQGDEISDFTKWIYASYMEGDLPEVKNSIYEQAARAVFRGFGTGYLAQEMVWWEEGETDNYYQGGQSAYDSLWKYYKQTGGWGNYSDRWNVQVLNFEKYTYDGKLETVQSQLVGVRKDPNTPPSEVPEPTTMALFGLGLLGFARVARKRNQK